MNNTSGDDSYGPSSAHTDFDSIHETTYEGWGFNFRSSQRYRYRKYDSIIRNAAITGSALEIGCSTGYFSNSCLYPIFRDRLIATDISRAAINKARQKFPQIRFEVSSLPNMNFERSSFDLVTATEVLNYLTVEDQKRSMDLIDSLLKPGGYFLVSVNIEKPKYFSVSEIESLVTRRFAIIHSDSIYLRTYYKVIEERIWGMLDLFTKKEKFRIMTTDSPVQKGLKRVSNIIMKNELWYHTAGYLLRSICKASLRSMPIGLINRVSFWLNSEKELQVRIILARKHESNETKIQEV